MPARGTHNGIQRFHNEDLVLEVGASVDRGKWNEDRYEPFLEELCGRREYQKVAIRVALRYLLGGEYRDLRDLATRNFSANAILRERYGSRDSLARHLQLPDQLSASLDLATGTGKSYVLYGIAAIMLAEGAVDRVLVLCPSTTIEAGLIEKFEELAGNADLRDALPATAATATPRIINASETIVAGSICVENYHAILAHVHGAIRDSLAGKGQTTLVLNDEAHHVGNETASKTKRWKEFLTDAAFGFRYVIGVSGTCYIGNEYFTDVIYRYSLRQAMEERFVKKVQYVAEMPRDTRRPEEEKWQLVRNRHEDIRRRLRPHKLRPLTIVVTRDIRGCDDAADKFKAFLRVHAGKTEAEVDDEVLVVHSSSPNLVRLPAVNSPNSRVEWIFSVSMLNEGWDVKRVFQIVPHEKRAFESKLLIAQVLGRGLRIPDDWSGPQPEVTVFNHDNWADDIRHLVYEVMEFEKRVPTFPVTGSAFDFELLNIEYDPKAYVNIYPMESKYKLFEKGYIDLSTEQPIEEVKIEFEEASTGVRSQWKTKIKHKTYTPRAVAEVMYQRFEDVPDDEDREFYTKEFPVETLEKLVRRSLKETQNPVITESIRQKFLQSLGPLHRKASQVVRYDFEPKNYFAVPTSSRPQESASASDLKHARTLFVTSNTLGTLPDEFKEFYEEATESGSGYKCFQIANHYDFKTPLNAVVADHDNERRFVKELVSAENVPYLDAWIKSTAMGFYEIDFFWKKGEHPKRGRFSPDFFIKAGPLVLVIEVKDDDEIADPSLENKKKYEYATGHFDRLNAYLRKKRAGVAYKFNFLTPSDFNNFFQSIRGGTVSTFQSALDVELKQ